MLCQALWIISKPSVDSRWNYIPETNNSGQNRRSFVQRDLEIWQMTLKKTIGHIFYDSASFVLNFVASCEFELE